jgi:hypothetical protein
MYFKKKGQVGVEYLIIFSFVIASVIIILGVALAYSASVGDSMRFSQIDAYANKIISSSETVFYSGVPSKATIPVYLPDSVQDVEIVENSIFITASSSSGTNKILYQCDVPISGTLSSNEGMKNIEMSANETAITISEV